MSQRKSVQFAEVGSEATPSDAELLRLSRKRRLNDASMSGDEVGQISSTYDSIGDQSVAGSDFAVDVSDAEFPKRQASGKHTLDSDEEDDNVVTMAANRLDVEDVEGQEEATVDFDEETKITPFNMREELEEGYYDKDGNFVFDKNKNEIRDEWIDNIDWTTVKTDAAEMWNEKLNEEDTFDELLPPIRLDRAELYGKILQYMKPGETLTKTLKRLNSNQKSEAEKRKERWQAKKKAAAAESAEKSEEPVKEPENDIVTLTGLVDKLVDEGEFEIYGATYEKLQFLFTKENKEKEEKIAVLKKAQDEVDIFGDDVNTGKLRTPKAGASTDGAKAEKDNLLASDEVLWQYKWTNDSEAKIHGPFTSSEMQKWKEEDFFPDGVWVRRVDQAESGREFYTSKRIDFDLYT